MQTSKEVVSKMAAFKEYVAILSKDSSQDSIRRQLLEVGEDICMLDPLAASQSFLDEHLWKFGFYSRFDHLKSDNIKFMTHLSLAISYYHVLILSLAAEYNLSLNFMESVNQIQSAALTIVYRSCVFLGDCYRYQNNIEIARKWYEQAFLILPRGGSRPQSQLALITPERSIYYHCLALGNKNASPWVRNNFSQAIKMKLELPIDKIWVPTDQNVKDLLSIVFNFEINMAKVRESVVCLLILIDDLNNQFELADRASKKQVIRFSQIIAMFLVLKTSKACIDQIELTDPDIDKLYASGLFCLWLERNRYILQPYFKYGSILDQKFKIELESWAHSLAKIANEASYFADFDGINEITTLDMDIIGTISFSAYFEKCLKSENQASNVYFSRITRCANEFANDPDVKFFAFQNLFYVVDDDYKRQKALATSSKMAQLLLKDQMSRNEKNTEDFAKVILIPDEHCFLNRLVAVKDILRRQKFTILVSQSVLSSLDAYKIGNLPINKQAREANRYLEQRFRFPSKWLIGQKPEQAIEPPEKDLFIPKVYLMFLECCLYYNTIGKVVVVTENEDLKGLAQSLKLPVASIDKCIAGDIS